MRATPSTAAALEKLFDAIAGEPGATDATLTLNHRRLRAHRQADDAIWFDVQGAVRRPARPGRLHRDRALLSHGVPERRSRARRRTPRTQARRFISLVDEFYDRAVKLIVSAAAPVTELYRGSKLTFEFERTQEPPDRDAVAGISVTPASGVGAVHSELRLGLRASALSSALRCAGAVAVEIHRSAPSAAS